VVRAPAVRQISGASNHANVVGAHPGTYRFEATLLHCPILPGLLRAFHRRRDRTLHLLELRLCLLERGKHLREVCERRFFRRRQHIRLRRLLLLLRLRGERPWETRQCLLRL